MNIEFESGILTIVYNIENTDIKKMKFDKEGCCQVVSKSDEVISEFQTVCSPAYNHQYGIPISIDGKLIFIGNWEKGLFCYDVRTGNLVWKQKPSKIRNIIVTSDALIVEVCDKGILLRLKHKVPKLTDLPVRELLDIMSMRI